MNIRGLMKKLQAAILKEGLVISLDTRQFYSEDQKRMITVYRVTTKVSRRKKSTGKLVEEPMLILSTASGIEVVQCLNDIYKAVRV